MNNYLPANVQNTVIFVNNYMVLFTMNSVQHRSLDLALLYLFMMIFYEP